ncbi:MAG: S8 family serine peptidase [Peptostreptococcaceae bacterium]
MKNRVKVAVLDTGIEKEHEYLKDNIIGGIAFESTDEYIFTSDKYDDKNGHGTACSSIIKKEFKDVEIFSVKILDDDGKSNIQILEESLKYLLKTNIRLINLSLSLLANEMLYDLYEICNELERNNKIVVCSLANGFDESYPAIFENVIGVKGFILEDENSLWYNKRKKIQCIIDNNSYFYCDLNNSYKLFGKCNSQAAAKLTGKIASILSMEPDISLEKLHEKLETIATRKNWSRYNLIASKRYPDFRNEIYENDDKIFLKVTNIVIKVLGLNKYDHKLNQYGLFNKHIGLTYDTCLDLVKEIEEQLNIKFDYMSISRYDFMSIYTLTELVEKKLVKDGII